MLRLPPYASNQWVPCPGSAQFYARYRDEAEEARDQQRRLEGLASHDIAERIIRNVLHPERSLPEPSVGDVANTREAAIVIDDDMLYGARLFASKVITRAASFLKGLHTERQISLWKIIEDLDGRADAVWIDETKKHLVVWDYKYGMGPIDVFENYQLLLYAIGLVLDYTTIETIELVLVKPFGHGSGHPVNTWTLTRDELDPYIERLVRAAEEARSDEAPVRPGTHCTYCPGRRVCPGLEMTAYSAIAYTDTAVPHELTAAETGAELKLLQRYEKALVERRKALEEDAIRKIKAGELVTGFAIGRTQSQRRWRSEKELEACATILGIDIREERLITPAAAHGRGMPETLVNKLTERPEGATKLVSAKAASRKAGETFK